MPINNDEYPIAISINTILDQYDEYDDLSIHFGEKASELKIKLYFEERNKKIEIFFDFIYGFRVLGEDDLMEFWKDYKTKDVGWILEIKKNGWYDLECKRNGFLPKTYSTMPYKEFMITSDDLCINVFAAKKPEVFYID